MHLTYQYQARPSRAQHRALERILEGQRLLYNAALQERRDAWRLAAKSISKIDQHKSLTAIRADDPEGYGALPVNMSRWTLNKVDEAFQGFFCRAKARAGRAGFPRFRGQGRWRSFGFAEFKGIRLVGDRLVFKGLTGGLRLWMHRPLPEGARICSCVFTHDGGRWTVNLQAELPDAIADHSNVAEAVGLDWGVENLATLSTGEAISNPRLGAAVAGDLRRAQRALARGKRGSKRRLKARRHLQALQRRLRNRRRAYLHQQSADMTRRFGRIAVEDLRIVNMTASAKGTAQTPGRNVRAKAGLNREILDTSPSTLLAMLTYKAARAGGEVVRIDSRGTSIECSGCGAKAPKALSVRMHSCPHRNLRLHRDVNAARVILRRAVAGPWSGGGEMSTRHQARRFGIVRKAVA